MLTNGRSIRGFTLLEISVVLAILGFLLLVGAPGYSSYSANNNLRVTAQSFYSSVQKARSEAISRNQIVELVLTNTAPPTPGNDNTAVATVLTESTFGPNWVIRAPNDAAASTYVLIDSKLGSDIGGGHITVNAGGTTKIQFNGVGETTSNANIEVQFRHDSQNLACDLAAAVRCLNVRIGAGGQARLCEPTPNHAIIDNRSC